MLFLYLPAMILLFQENSSPPQITLNPEESRHLIRVLRKQQGDPVQVTDGKDQLFHCQIAQADPKNTLLIVRETEQIPPSPFEIHLAIAPTKNSDRMEWMLEKCTEIGFHELHFFHSKHSERSFLKMDRMEKKLIAACKQSKQTRKPKIHSVRKFDELVQDKRFGNFQKFIAYVDDQHTHHLFDAALPNRNYLIFIGPEGDFDPMEIQMAREAGNIPVSLGKSRLRTETAGLAAVQMLQLLNR